MAKKKTIELTRAKAMEIFHQDGVLEIVAGAVLLNFGFDILNQGSMTSLFTYIPIVLMSSLKNQITIARIGLDSFNGDETKVRNWNLAAAVGMVITLVALSMIVLNDTLNIRAMINLPIGEELPSLLAGIILALGCLAAGLLIPLKRFLFYAAAALVIGVVSFFAFPAQVLAFVFAGVLLGNGARMMVKFSRAFPLKKDQEKKEK
ncbi:MAG TPA: hypothetical protein VMW28_05530 [Pelolinea sp.]|nr:hypothetical protein [Pelolinea sp.]